MCPLVSIEGIDSAGKTTLVRALPALLANLSTPVVVCTERMSPFGHLLEKEKLGDLSPLVKAYLFAADRAWTYEKHCEPALMRGELVIWERYVDSALAYRAADAVASGASWLAALTREINKPFATPDLILLLEILPITSTKRSHGRTNTGVEHLERVRQAYEQLAKEGRPYARVNGEQSMADCAAEAASAIQQHMFGRR